MTELHDAQRLAFQLLKEESGHHFFVRIAAEDHSLWVCDLPRFHAELENAQARLLTHGIICRLDEKTKLWYMDWTQHQYEAILSAYPSLPPPLPTDDALHPAYALCRLLLHSPVETGQPQDLVRRMLKLCQLSRPHLLQAIPKYHSQCAQLLRQGRPLPHASGRILAKWLTEQEAER